jgi:hypothetical protein
MTHSPQYATPSILDVLGGTVTEWYDQVDQVLKASEVIPGQYEYSVNTSYANSGPFSEGGSTHFDISCDRFKIISLDNSYIHLKQTISVEVEKDQVNTYYAAGGVEARMIYYFGYKSVFDAIGQYRISSNQDLIQTVNKANYESFLFYNSLTDECKENSDMYATYEKVFRMDQNVPGVYIDLAGVHANATVKVPIDIRIPLNMFMLLMNIKWYPSFWGKLDIEIYPSYKNLVYTRVFNPLQKAKVSETVNNIYGFHQLNQTTHTLFVMGKTGTQAPFAYPCTMSDQKFICNTSTTDQCHIRLAQYMVKMDIYNMLQAKYIQLPMLFPVQEVSYKDFTGKLTANTNGNGYTCVQTMGLNYANSMFVVFPEDVNSTTCFLNPQITFQVNIDGKFFPRDKYSTIEDVRFTNMYLDATNFNNKLTCSIGNDVWASLQPRVVWYEAAVGGAITKRYWYDEHADSSNFAIAIPFCHDDDFMAGLSTQGTVQVEMTGERTASGPNLLLQSPVAMFIEDRIAKFRAIKPSGESQIKIVKATIEEILAGSSL